jgi:hypothetical protein
MLSQRIDTANARSIILLLRSELKGYLAVAFTVVASVSVKVIDKSRGRFTSKPEAPENGDLKSDRPHIYAIEARGSRRDIAGTYPIKWKAFLNARFSQKTAKWRK